MQVSAEIRWFWIGGQEPRTLKDWFCSANDHDIPAGGGDKERRDDYVATGNQIELGIKRRAVKEGVVSKEVEIKGLVDRIPAPLIYDPFAGPAEIWTKWASGAMSVDEKAIVSLTKLRWLRKFDTSGAEESKFKELWVGKNEQPIGSDPPKIGCNVELTRLLAPGGQLWWTFGFEAFGTIRDVEPSLRLITRALAGRNPPDFSNGTLLSYPAWLRVQAGR
jgi:hypothetical protein